MAIRTAESASRALDTDWRERTRPVNSDDDRLRRARGMPEERAHQSRLVRDIFPFEPAKLDSAWLHWQHGQVVALADAILSYPVNPSFSSLNLAQAVALLAHAYAEADASGPPAAFADPVDVPAPREELVGMMEHFEEELDRAGFFFPEAKRAPITQNLRNAFTRAGWTAQEVSTFRGAIKALAVGRGKARVNRDT